MRLFILLATSVILLSGCSRVAQLRQSNSANQTATPTSDTSIPTIPTSEDGGSPISNMQDDSSARTEKSGVPAARQVDFVSREISQGFVAAGPTVYFFKASWCPTCQAAQKDLNANIDDLPAGTTIVTVDYDKEVELKKQYNITYQHTWVQIDARGTEIAKWQGGGVDEVAKNIKMQ